MIYKASKKEATQLYHLNGMVRSGDEAMVLLHGESADLHFSPDDPQGDHRQTLRSPMRTPIRCWQNPSTILLSMNVRGR